MSHRNFYRAFVIPFVFKDHLDRKFLMFSVVVSSQASHLFILKRAGALPIVKVLICLQEHLTIIFLLSLID